MPVSAAWTTAGAVPSTRPLMAAADMAFFNPANMTFSESLEPGAPLFRRPARGMQATGRRAYDGLHTAGILGKVLWLDPEFALLVVIDEEEDAGGPALAAAAGQSLIARDLAGGDGKVALVAARLVAVLPLA